MDAEIERIMGWQVVLPAHFSVYIVLNVPPRTAVTAFRHIPDQEQLTRVCTVFDYMLPFGNFDVQYQCIMLLCY